MLQNSTLRFLSDLRKNNNREWFAENKAKYDAANADFQAFVGTLLEQLQKIDPALEGLLPKDCVFRIYRDVRFSKNKDPYKCNFAASIKPGGRKSNNCGFYLHIEQGGDWGSFAAGGFWMPEAPVLKKIRQEIEYNYEEFEGILKNKTFKKLFGDLEEQGLKKAPKGYDPEHPGIEYIKRTSFIATHEIDKKDITSANLLKECVSSYKAMKPLVDFLNRSLD